MKTSLGTYNNITYEAIIGEDKLSVQLLTYWEASATHPKVDRSAFDLTRRFNGSIAEPCLLVASQDKKIIGLLVARIVKERLDLRIAYKRVARPSATILAILDHGFREVGKNDIAKGFIRATMRLLDDGIADFAHFSCVGKDSDLWEAALQIPDRKYQSPLAGTDLRWVLELPATYEDFLSSRSTNSRSNLRRTERKLLRECPDIRVQRITQKTFKHSRPIDRMLQIAEKTYQYRMGLSPLVNESTPKIWNQLGVAGRLRGIIVSIDEQPVAFACAQVYKDTAYFLTPGFDPTFATLKIGQFALTELIKLLIDDDALHFFDYGLGDAQYKKSFSTHCYEQGHIRLFAPSIRGLYLNTVRSSVGAIDQMLRTAANKSGLKKTIKRALRRQATNA